MTDLTAGSVLGARFLLLRRLGRGGTAEVWLARDRERDREVALKVLHDTSPGAVPPAWPAALPASAIVPVEERLEADGRMLLVMAYLEGGDLGQFRGRPFASWAAAVADVVAALAALHAAGFVHRDLKCGNVLLDADGRARLADGALLAPVGALAPPGGSPYNASPQQLRGEPAQPADDCYALGALLYELIGGHPPYYPEVTRERVLWEPVPPLLPLAEVPVRVRELALRLLAKSPAERPQSLADVRAVLVGAAGAAAEQELPPPPPLPARAGPARRALRWRWLLAGAVALAALALVFVVLPRWAAERGARLAEQARTEAAAQTTRQQQREQRQQELAAARTSATAAGQRFQQEFAGLDLRQAARWATEPFAAARAAGAQAAQAFATGDFAAAQAAWQQGLARLDGIGQQRPAALRRELARGAAALDAGRLAEGREAYALAAAIEPGDAGAAAGLARAERLQQALARIDAALRDEQAGRLAAAEQGFRQALALERTVPGGAVFPARLPARRAGDAYATAMARGLAEQAAGRNEAARAAFARALELRPGAAEAQEALAGLEQGERARTLGELVARAGAAESEERWDEAQGAWREALALEPGLATARAGIERSAPRAELQQRIEALLAAPERLWEPRGRAGARALVEAAARAEAPRQRLAARSAELERLVAAAETPLRLRLESDGLTEVVIWRVGRFGTFTERDVELLPGRYTIVGTRNGYRDVRREVELRPGAQPAAVLVRCEEPV